MYVCTDEECAKKKKKSKKASGISKFIIKKKKNISIVKNKMKKQACDNIDSIKIICLNFFININDYYLFMIMY